MDLSSFRTKIDKIDERIIELIAERFGITQKVGEYKKLHGLTAVDPSRESLQFTRYKELAISHNLDPELVQNIMRLVINEVVKNHNLINERQK